MLAKEARRVTRDALASKRAREIAIIHIGTCVGEKLCEREMVERDIVRDRHG